MSPEPALDSFRRSPRLLRRCLSRYGSGSRRSFRSSPDRLRHISSECPRAADSVQPDRWSADLRAGQDLEMAHGVFSYRAEVDGLRAIAVVPVVLSHAGLEWFRGGYVGVDVFFVISGYLITS